MPVKINIRNVVNRKSLPALLATLAVIVLAAGVAFAVNRLWPKLKEVHNEVKGEKDLASKNHLKLAEEYMHIGKFDESFASLQNALDSSVTQEARVEAGLLMGQLLVSKARTEPVPYALMAKQYLLAVLDMEKRPEVRLMVFRQLIMVAAIMKDVDGIVSMTKDAKALVTDPDAKVELLLIQLDAQLDAGTWKDVKALLIEADKAMSASTRWQYDYAIRSAMVSEKLLMKREWFDEWRKDHPTVSADELKARLFDNTVAKFNVLLGSGVEKLMEEARFRNARLYYQAGQFAEAQKRLSDYFNRDPVKHVDETLLMMTSLARQEGRTADAEEMMLIFLKRFPWNRAAAAELLSVVDMAMEKGHLKESLGLLEKFSSLPSADKMRPELLAKSGDVAVKLGLYDRAEYHFKKLMAIGCSDRLAVTAMLSLADVCTRKKDYEGAKAWLTRLINRYPYEKRSSEALYGLSEIFEKISTNTADIISMAVVAAKRGPDDPRAMTALLMAARKLEEMGLTGLAQVQYSRISTLGNVRVSGQGSERLDSASPIAQAMLGDARCLIAMKDSMRADRVLRELCNSVDKGPLLSEAAFWWASLAADRRQHMEARRRIALMDDKDIRPEIAVRVSFEKMLMEIGAGERSAESINTVLEKLVNFPAGDQTEFVLKAYMTCFERLQEQNDLDGMKRFFTSAAGSPHAKNLPLRYFNLCIGKAVFKKSGSMAFADCMKTNDHVMKASGVMETNSVDPLVDMAQDVGGKVERVTNFLKVSTNES